LRHTALPDEAWRSAVFSLPVLLGLSEGELERLRELATLFLNEKQMVAAGGFLLDDDTRIKIAAQACLPILNLGLDYYAGWVSVIVYPGEFVPEHEFMDEDGVVHVIRDSAMGESWERGPVVLSGADAVRCGEHDGVNGHARFPHPNPLPMPSPQSSPASGRGGERERQSSISAGEGANESLREFYVNVVIHEFAHKLDMLNGAMNGFPPLHREMSAEQWAQAFSAAYADFCAKAERNMEMVLDPYGAESPAEFFAVTSEAFFETPHVLRQEYPEVYRQLAAFYRQDTVSRRSTESKTERRCA
jgi:Mlc titration factor MtfA (ptsG expression regulator)